MNRKMIWLGASCLAGTALIATPAMAADAAAVESSPAIIVTAPLASDTTTLSNVPANAQVLSGDALIRQNHENLADLLNANLGSISLSNGTGSPYQSDVSYRGFQATSLLGSPTGLSVYLDGVRMNEAFGSIVNWDLIPLNAVRQVEVLPGSNPLFGLNTLGGALVLDTKNGADNGGLGVTMQAGSFNRKAVQAEAGGTFANKAFDWFVAGNYDEQDGYRWYTSTLVKQAYGKLRWHGTSANAELGAVWSDTSLNGTQALPLSMLGTPQMAYTWPDNVSNNQVIVNFKADARLAPNVKISGNVYYRRSNAHSSNSNASNDDGCEGGESRNCTADAVNGTALDLYQINPYAQGTAKYANFRPYTGSLPIHNYEDNINTSMVLSNVNQRTFGGNALVDVDAPLFGLKNDFNLGGSWETSSIRYNQSTYLAYLVNYQTVMMPWNFKYGSAAGFQGNPLVSSVGIASHNSSYNIFARDMLSLTDTLGITGSVSFTSTHVSLRGSNSQFLNEDGGFSWTGNDGLKYYNPAYIGASYWTTSSTAGAGSSLTTAKVPTGGVAGPEVAPVVGSHTYRRVNPAVGLVWNPLKEIGLFANYSEAMRAPTAIELACADPARPCALPTGFNGDPDLKPVVAHTIEVGGRGAIGRHLGWNVAFYRTRLNNDIQFIFDSSGLGYFANVGKTQRQGVEVGLTGDFAKLHLGASYGHVAATYRSSFTDENGDTVQPGNHITGIPSDTVKLRVLYTPIRQLALGANLIAVSSQYAHGDEANLNGAVPGYALVNLDLHVMPVPHLELFANITNLFNRHYATFGVLGTNIYNGQDEQFRTPAPGRAFMLGVRYNFGRNPGSSGED
jgi:outer membrane receptor protein involved in Fe transport